MLFTPKEIVERNELVNKKNESLRLVMIEEIGKTLETIDFDYSIALLENLDNNDLIRLANGLTILKRIET